MPTKPTLTEYAHYVKEQYPTPRPGPEFHAYTMAQAVLHLSERLEARDDR